MAYGQYMKLQINEPVVNQGSVIVNVRVLQLHDKTRMLSPQLNQFGHNATYDLGSVEDHSVYAREMCISTDLWKMVSGNNVEGSSLLKPGLVVTSCFNGMSTTDQWSVEGIANSTFVATAHRGPGPKVSLNVGGSATTHNTGKAPIRAGYFVRLDRPPIREDRRIIYDQDGISQSKLLPITSEVSGDRTRARFATDVLDAAFDAGDMKNSFTDPDIARIMVALEQQNWDLQDPQSFNQTYERTWDVIASGKSFDMQYALAEALFGVLYERVLGNKAYKKRLMSIHQQVVNLVNFNYTAQENAHVLGKCIEPADPGKKLRMLLSSSTPHQHLR